MMVGLVMPGEILQLSVCTVQQAFDDHWVFVEKKSLEQLKIWLVLWQANQLLNSSGNVWKLEVEYI